MLRAILAAAAALLAPLAAAQQHAPHPWQVPVPPPPAASSPSPSRPAPPVAAQPQGPAAPQAAAPAQPAAPAGRNAKAIDRLKSIGRTGVQKAAPRLGVAEKLVKDKGGTFVDRAVDLAVERAGLAPAK